MEAIKVIQETQVTQEVPSTTGAKPQVEAQANTEVQTMEDTIISLGMTTITQPIKHPTILQITPNKVDQCGVLFV